MLRGQYCIRQVSSNMITCPAGKFYNGMTSCRILFSDNSKKLFINIKHAKAEITKIRRYFAKSDFELGIFTLDECDTLEAKVLDWRYSIKMNNCTVIRVLY